MTEQKNLKRRVRARMEKTGERYTAARRHVVGDEPEPFVTDPVMADETLVEKTGKTWSEWVAITTWSKDSGAIPLGKTTT